MRGFLAQLEGQERAKEENEEIAKLRAEVAELKKKKPTKKIADDFTTSEEFQQLFRAQHQSIIDLCMKSYRQILQQKVPDLDVDNIEELVRAVIGGS